MIVLAVICFGLVPWFVRSLAEAGLASPAIVFFRFAISAAVLSPFLGVGSKKFGQLRWAFLSGIVVALGYVGYVEALEAAPVAIVGVLYMTYPLFTLLITWLWWRRPPAGRSVLGAVLVLVGAVIALSPAVDTGASWAAALIALTAPLTFAFAINVLTGKLSGLSGPERAAGFTLGAVTGLLPMVLSLPLDQLLPPSPSDWLLVVSLSLITSLLPNLLFATAGPVLGPARTAAAGSFELPTIFLVGWLGLGEPLGPMQLLAGGLVVLAILMTPVDRIPAVPVIKSAAGAGPP
ncbi:MAG: DMT family transporter [Geminicoccaceae bacterium]